MYIEFCYFLTKAVPITVGQSRTTRHETDRQFEGFVANLLTPKKNLPFLSHFFASSVPSMAMFSSSVTINPFSLRISTPYPTTKIPAKFSLSVASSLRPSSSSSAAEASHDSQSATKTENIGVSAKGPSPKEPYVEPPEFQYSYALANPNGNPVVKFVQSTESTIERVCQIL